MIQAVVASAAAAAAVAALLKLKCRAQKIEDVPTKMKALLLMEGDPDMAKARLEVHEVDTPKPRPGQVLVRMVAAPINPSDDGEWRVKVPGAQPKPCGNEGCGIVVATGGGVAGWWLLGRKVAVVGAKTYMQYTVTSALGGALPLPDEVPVEDGCAFFVNPFTVVGIVDTVRQQGENIFIHTAAASQLGQMMVKYCKAIGVDVVNVVRRPEQAEILKALGAEHIIDTSNEAWQEELSTLIKARQICVAFDAIAGNMTGTLLRLLPAAKSKVFVYGRLDKDPVGNIDPLDLIYRGKKLEGWLLPKWILGRGRLRALLRTWHTSKFVGAKLETVFGSQFQDTTMQQALSDYIKVRQASGATGTKLRLRIGR